MAKLRVAGIGAGYFSQFHLAGLARDRGRGGRGLVRPRSRERGRRGGHAFGVAHVHDVSPTMLDVGAARPRGHRDAAAIRIARWSASWRTRGDCR